ncbi:uncharacterized protein N7483_003520 [Penicillium malachiteum]|uniref:uncharacterized protein n=1 Tax=Penicillium malachiteum TaxID=1324776 RepID=UPI002548EEA3|nr:uncharacterized protein N7483_003520 [Penicillium malachiteum]KAJ5729012.1 hypothetical protein N7483_003520 [Penicillium malachiteum]
MWLYRGAQSAVFFYATCTPCAMSIDRRKRKKDAARSQREKERCDAEIEIIADQPRPFPQPVPFSTNEGWREEIALGPGPPTRRGGNRNNQRTNSWNTDQSLQSKKDKSGSLMHPLGERLNRMRNQREDEPLWGQEIQEVRGSSIGFSGRGRVDPSEPSKYYAAYCPPVNDLHPPIVSGPRSRAETRWMLQPPPSAKVMAGKESFKNSARDSMGGMPGDRLSRAMSPLSPHRETVLAERISNDGAPDTESLHQQLPCRPAAIRTREHSNSISRDDLDLSRHSRSDSMFSMTNTDDLSLSTSWKYPDTPATRPTSKTDESDKVLHRPQISKTLSTLHRPDNKQKVHLLHVEINDEDRGEVDFGQLERIRPWRWSMDI